MTKTFISKLKSKAKSIRKISPSIKLLRDIQDDYWEYSNNGKYIPSSKKGFLDTELYIDDKKYYVISSNQNNTSFDLTIKDINNQIVFFIRILYGQKYNCDLHIIYIEKFYRTTNKSCGIGKKMLEYIKELAESKGFDIIGVHPVALIDANKGYMSQETLEDFYRKNLYSNSFKLEFMDNSDCIIHVDMERR